MEDNWFGKGESGTRGTSGACSSAWQLSVTLSRRVIGNVDDGSVN